MLVYGDRSDVVDSTQWLGTIASSIAVIASSAPGLKRHGKLVGALIDAGRLWQGVADECSGCPEIGTLVHELARSVVRSFDSGFEDMGPLPPVPAPDLPATVDMRLPEGFAFYTVYPEAYITAARRLSLEGRPKIIGMRSIGTTLGPIVAAAIGGADALTVRPFGDPFARQVNLPPETIEPGVHYIIVDEGPGLSGSSFGAVADWLQVRGVPLERIAFIPSHPGELGPEASDVHRAMWGCAQRVAAEFDPSFLEEIFGPLRTFSGGGAFQRTKFLARDNRGPMLIKFAGLGSIGESKLDMARLLHSAGFAPEPLALTHGFLVERWDEGARPLLLDEAPVDEIGEYIGTRARIFSADYASGAGIDQLLTMCRRNIGLSMGEKMAGQLRRFKSDELSRRVKRVRTDNKMEREEWLRRPDGRLIKVDALDHHQSHDLIGCQGPEWDVAGAAEEFGLSPAEEARLVRATKIELDTELLVFYRIAYAAFRLGQSHFAGEPDAAGRYARSIELLLHQNS